MVKARYNGPSDDLYLIDNNIYEVISVEADISAYVVVDEVGDHSVVPKDCFTIVEGSEEDLDWYETDQTTLEDILVHKGKH